MFLDTSIDFTLFPLGGKKKMKKKNNNFKATETRVMNVLITALSYRAALRKRNQTKAAQRANER